MMTATTDAAKVEQRKSRQKLAADGMSKVQRLHRALQSGPLKSELRTVSESIHAARGLFKQIEQTGMERKDFAVHIAYMTPDLSALFTRSYVPGEEAKIQAELSGPGTCCIPVGLTFGLRDMERGNWVVGARPFLRTPLVTMAFAGWLKQTFDENT
jgi:hypothetical protein